MILAIVAATVAYCPTNPTSWPVRIALLLHGLRPQHRSQRNSERREHRVAFRLHKGDGGTLSASTLLYTWIRSSVRTLSLAMRDCKLTTAFVLCQLIFKSVISPVVE